MMASPANDRQAMGKQKSFFPLRYESSMTSHQDSGSGSGELGEKKKKKNLLLQQDRTETRVESTNTLILQDLTEPTNKTGGELRLTDETNTGSLKRTQSDISEELSGGRRSQVDGSLVLSSGLVAQVVDALLLEELVTTELEGALEEVTRSGGTEAG